MWMKQQQAQDSDSASDTEAKDRKSEKLQPSTSSGHHGHWMYYLFLKCHIFITPFNCTYSRIVCKVKMLFIFRIFQLNVQWWAAEKKGRCLSKREEVVTLQYVHKTCFRYQTSDYIPSVDAGTGAIRSKHYHKTKDYIYNLTVFIFIYVFIFKLNNEIKLKKKRGIFSPWWSWFKGSVGGNHNNRFTRFRLRILFRTV